MMRLGCRHLQAVVRLRVAGTALSAARHGRRTPDRSGTWRIVYHVVGDYAS